MGVPYGSVILPITASALSKAVALLSTVVGAFIVIFLVFVTYPSFTKVR